MFETEFNELKPADEGLPPPSADGGGAPAVTSEAPPPTLRETILAAKAEVEANADKPAADRARGPDGKFVTRDAPEKAAAPVKVPAQAVEPKPELPTTQPDANAAPQPSTAAAAPPPGWSPDAKAEFAKLPAAVQQAVVRREQEVSTGFAQYAQRAKDFDQALSPGRHLWASQGISDAQAVGNFVKWQQALADPNMKGEAFKELAEIFGVDLSTVIPAQGDPYQAEQPDQNTQRLLARIGQLEKQVGTVSGTLQQQEQARLQQELTVFAKDKPHYEKVRANMAYLLSPLRDDGGRIIRQPIASNLLDAYQKAVAFDPEIQAQIQQSAQQPAQAPVKSQPARDPRRAAVSVRGGAPNGAAGPSVGAPGESVRDSLRRAFAESAG